jgi:hypothetical protein
MCADKNIWVADRNGNASSMDGVANFGDADHTVAENILPNAASD